MMMRIVAIVQARMGSTRLPKKVLADILGKPMLWHLIHRLRESEQLDDIVVATTKRQDDDEIAEFSTKNSIECFRGSDLDVLDRYYQCASEHNAETIVRITADCPLMDPELLDRAISFFRENPGKFDHMGPPERYPEGLDIEVFTFDALKEAWENAKKPSEREHVTPYIWSNPTRFKVGRMPSDLPESEDHSSLHWSVDEPCDLDFVREVYAALYTEGRAFGIREVLDLMEKNPRIKGINQGFTGYEGYARSLEEDEKFLKKTK